MEIGSVDLIELTAAKGIDTELELCMQCLELSGQADVARRHPVDPITMTKFANILIGRSVGKLATPLPGWPGSRSSPAARRSAARAACGGADSPR